MKGVYNALASQVDVLPTLAGLANINYTNSSLGRDLLHVKDTSTNAAFIFEAETKRIGIIQRGIFYSMTIDNPKTGNWVSIRTNEAPQLTADVKDQYKATTEAFYNTARYLLLNNKKR